ncbi:MAG: beta-propeller fold lactonase family protein, partial [Bryobacteraceae bacterium]|nr:beta-propeller fold lactonase family protein [Bryobacteraceae bacterium]
PGGGVVIILPPAPGGIIVPVPPTLPGGIPTPQNPAIAANSPTVRSQNTSEGSRLDLDFTAAAAARTPGTVSPTHTFLVQSNEAINIPSSVRVFQNFRDSESRGSLIPIPVGLSANEALEDMVVDQVRRRLYIANSGLNRIEVFDMRTGQLMNPIRAGQLPRSLAMTPDGATLYVANSGGENIGIVDLDRMQVTGRVKFPPLPFNSGAATITPSIIAASERGLQVLMNNGTLWKVVGNEAVPRNVSPAIGSSVIAAPRTMVATPNGEYIMLLAGTGFAYLYDALADEYIQARQVFTNPITGFYGPVAAGPRGQFYVANGTILNAALTPIGTPALATGRPVAAVASVGPSSFVRFTQPVRANANAPASDPGTVEVVDVNSGFPIRTAAALEGPISTLVGGGRVNINGRTMAVDAAGTTVYALTTTGLSVLPLETPLPSDRPVLNQNGTVSLSSYIPAFAPGSLITLFGRNLAASETSSEYPAPNILGGVCITLNSTPLPLLMTSAGQVNAAIPPELAAGRYSMVVRSVDRKAASVPQQLTLARVAPSIFADPVTKEALLFRSSGQRVSKENPARRDESLMLFATGLGATKGGRAVSGRPSPATPLAEVDDVQLYFGDPRYRQSEMIVEWAGLTPGLIGIYQINLRVPGDRNRGRDLPVTLRSGGVESQKTGPVVPVVSVD